MINVRTIRKLAENDGLTLKNGKIIRYKTGWQVATEGVICHTPQDAIKAVKAYDGNCGVWLAASPIRNLFRTLGKIFARRHNLKTILFIPFCVMMNATGMFAPTVTELQRL